MNAEYDTAENNTRECPYCKEEIKIEAVKCKHCSSSVAPEKPSHEGTCPLCKEKIHSEATKCKHCKSSLLSTSTSTSTSTSPKGDCNCEPSVAAFRPTLPGRGMRPPRFGDGSTSDCYLMCLFTKWECEERGNSKEFCEWLDDLCLWGCQTRGTWLTRAR